MIIIDQCIPDRRAYVYSVITSWGYLWHEEAFSANRAWSMEPAALPSINFQECFAVVSPWFP